MAFPQAWQGTATPDVPPGFPVFTARRVPRAVTSDVWSYFRYVASERLPRSDERVAISFIDQAFEFFTAASNPNLASRPLLYYYAFLNLAKAALLIERVQLPAAVQHGISDPRVNQRQRVRFAGQIIRMERQAHNRQQIFPELVSLLGGDVTRPRDYGVLTLLSQVPGVHRTYCRVTREAPRFVPISRFEVLHDGSEYWVRVVLKRDDQDVRSRLSLLVQRWRFSSVLDCVASPNPGERWFQTGYLSADGRAVDGAIRDLGAILRGLGVWTILTNYGQRHYFGDFFEPGRLPGLAAIYAVMFYLGSITRYKPYAYESIVERYSWLIGEFLRTQPAQFLYGIAGVVGGVEVVRPYAAID